MSKSSSCFQSIPYRSANNYDMFAASDESAITCPEPSLAIQSAKDECDINNILANMARGINPSVSRVPQYGDFTSSATTYHNALNTVIAAQNAFDLLPGTLRARFDNNPEALLAFVCDEANYDEAVKLGLIASTEALADAKASASSSGDPRDTKSAVGAPEDAPGRGKKSVPKEPFEQ